MDARLRPLIGPKQIAAKIGHAARIIDREYSRKDLVILMVLKGSICLTADLIRALKIPCDIEVVTAQSYGQRGTRRGKISIFGLEKVKLSGRDVLIVDDIFDSGQTLSSLYKVVRKKKPKSLKSLVLLKKNIARVSTISPDFVLFDIENHFVVGYGLDYMERYRGLPGINILENDP